MGYKEDDYLQLSGLQHFFFCRRQWALIHVENQWAENYWTVDGTIMHEAAHDMSFQESRRDCLTVRGMRVHSSTLGVSGACDVVEFHRVDPDTEGTPLQGREGLWQPFPVEYKRGSPSSHTPSDELQLCGQAMCLEEMLCCAVPCGALYYGETRHRYPVAFTEELRGQVRLLLEEMHDLFRRGTTPRVKPQKACRACSLNEICLPGLTRAKPAGEYIRAHWEAVE